MRVVSVIAVMLNACILVGCSIEPPKAKNAGPTNGPTLVTATGAELISKGLDYLGGDITGLSAPSQVNGAIAEGTPIVSVVYFGRSAKAGKLEARLYSCNVPEQYQIDSVALDAADKSDWTCGQING